MAKGHDCGMPCVVACHDTERCTGRRRTASHKAMAYGTLAPTGGEQAAEGQTARWSFAKAPGRELWRLLALCLARMRNARTAKKAALEKEEALKLFGLKPCQQMKEREPRA